MAYSRHTTLLDAAYAAGELLKSGQMFMFDNGELYDLDGIIESLHDDEYTHSNDIEVDEERYFVDPDAGTISRLDDVNFTVIYSIVYVDESGKIVSDEVREFLEQHEGAKPCTDGTYVAIVDGNNIVYSSGEEISFNDVRNHSFYFDDNANFVCLRCGGKAVELRVLESIAYLASDVLEDGMPYDDALLHLKTWGNAEEDEGKCKYCGNPVEDED